MKWYKQRPQRCKAEMMAIKRIYPKARILEYKGHLLIFLKVPSRKTRYLIKVVYPGDFPYGQPRAYVIEPKIKDAPHRWPDGRLSVHEDHEGPHTSGKIILDLTKKWIEAYEKWLDTGRWTKKIRR